MENTFSHLLILRESWAKKLNFKISNYTFDEILYFIGFSLYLGAHFITGTMFNTGAIPYKIFMASAVIVGFKIILYNPIKKIWTAALCILLMFIFHISASHSNLPDIFYYYIMILGAFNVDYRKIVKLTIIEVAIGLLITFISAKMGTIIGLTYDRNNGSYNLRYALGTIYPSDLAARIFYMSTFYVMYRKFRLSIPEYLSLLLLTVWTYLVTITKLDTILMMLLIITAVFYSKIVGILEKITYKAMIYAELVAVAAICLLSYFYTDSNPILRAINNIITGRLYFAREAFNRYNVTLYGQNVLQNGSGGIHHGSFDYFYIDCSYIRLLMMSGLVSFVIVIGLLAYLTYYFVKNKFYPLLIALFLVFLSSFIDQHLLEISYNILLLSLFANCSYFFDNIVPFNKSAE